MKENFFEDYHLQEEIGRGTFAIINRCFNKRTEERLACKTVWKARLRDSLDMDSIRNEIRILRHLASHRGVVQLHDVYEEEECVRLVMELCSGRDLLDTILHMKRFCEEEAAGVLRRVMEAVDLCHRKGVAHRDLKPDNILFSSDNLIRLADFGQASFFTSGEKMNGIVGTPYYVAPEVLQGKEYDEKVDVWSAGVILYIMLCGTTPFSGNTPQQIFEEVLRGRLRFPSDPWQTISQPAKDLIRRMVCRDVQRRFRASQVLEHPWLKRDVQ